MSARVERVEKRPALPPRFSASREPTYVARRHDAGAIAHLLRTPAGGLIEDPGVGKTGQVLATFHVLRKKNLVDQLLVMAPLNPVYEVWPREVEKWNFPFEVQILHGKERRVLRRADVYVTNYDSLDWLVENLTALEKVARGKRWWIVFDESTKIKHTNTQRFKALKEILHRFPRRSILTGTPAPNGLMDLFGQVYAVDFGERLGRFITQYRREYFYPTGYGGYNWVLQEDGEKRIYKKLDGLFYRVSDAILDLPLLHDVPLYISLPPMARKLYEELEREFVLEIKDRVITAVNAAVLSMKLRQCANGRLYDTEGRTAVIHDEKVSAVEDLVEQLQGNPLLVGFEFIADGERLAKALGAPVIDGSVSPKKRRPLFAAFNAGKLPALLCQNDTVALGVNLQEACHTIALFGLTWNLETYQQLKKRVHRGGQKQTVTVHHILARNTIEETQWVVLRKKDARQAALLEAIKRRYL